MTSPSPMKSPDRDAADEPSFLPPGDTITVGAVKAFVDLMKVQPVKDSAPDPDDIVRWLENRAASHERNTAESSDGTTYHGHYGHGDARIDRRAASELATLRRRVDAAGALLGKWLRTGRDLPGLVICEEIRRVLSPPAQPRDESTGQYGFDGDFSRVCVCGHPLGVHTAAAPHECMNGDRGCPGANGDACDCRGFKPRRHKARASLSPPTRKE